MAQAPGVGELAQVAAVIRDAVALLDESGDARQGPQLGVEAMGLGPLEHAGDDVLHLSVGESARLAGRADPQRGVAALLIKPHPVADGFAVNTQPSAGLGAGEPFVEHEPDGLAAAGMKFRRGAVWSHVNMMPPTN